MCKYSLKVILTSLWNIAGVFFKHFSICEYPPCYGKGCLVLVLRINGLDCILKIHLKIYMHRDLLLIGVHVQWMVMGSDLNCGYFELFKGHHTLKFFHSFLLWSQWAIPISYALFWIWNRCQVICLFSPWRSFHILDSYHNASSLIGIGVRVSGFFGGLVRLINR